MIYPGETGLRIFPSLIKSPTGKQQLCDLGSVGTVITFLPGSEGFNFCLSSQRFPLLPITSIFWFSLEETNEKMLPHPQLCPLALSCDTGTVTWTYTIIGLYSPFLFSTVSFEH